MNANYQICRQHRDPDDIAAGMGLSPLRMDIRGNNRIGTNRPELRRLRDEILTALATEGWVS